MDVKICGVTSEADACWIARLGVDAIGVNFHPPSSRFVSPRAGASIARASSPARVVGVFVDRPAREILDIVGMCGLDVAQLHGAESPRAVAELAPLPVWKAFRVRSRESLDEIKRYLAECDALGAMPERILLDAYHPAAAGGAGVVWDWDMLGTSTLGIEWLLAGGLTPDNVGDAIRRLRPSGVDVASGVESAPGVKHRQLVSDFVSAARGALPHQTEEPPA